MKVQTDNGGGAIVVEIVVIIIHQCFFKRMIHFFSINFLSVSIQMYSVDIIQLTSVTGAHVVRQLAQNGGITVRSLK